MKTLFLFLVLILFYSPSSAQFMLNGAAVDLGNNTFKLTDPVNSQFGAIWHKIQHDMNTDFTVQGQMNFGTDPAGADGIAFVMQQNCLSAGSIGGGLGFSGIPGASFEIEFDTYQNIVGTGTENNFDPVFDHIAVEKNADVVHDASADDITVPIQMHSTLSNVKNGNWFNFTISWNATTNNLIVTFAGTERVNIIYDIQGDAFGGDQYTYWGFTSTTGGFSNLQQIIIDPGNSTFVLDDYTICSGSVPITLPSLNSFAGTNLALNKPITASSGTGLVEVNDGNLGTRWESVWAVDPQWIYVDLGVQVDITSVELVWEAAYATAFEIQTSTDAISWATQYSTATNTGGTNVINFTANDVRYVRMYGTARSLPLYGYSIWEFRVFGTPNYLWSPDDGTIDDIYGESVVITPVSTQTYSVVIPDGCIGSTTYDFTITVVTPPVVNDYPDQSFCTNETTGDFIFTGNDPGNLYAWTNDNISTGLVASGTGPISSFITTNTGSSPITSTITVTPSLGLCSGIAEQFTITVNPIPSFSVLSSNPTTCNGTDGSITITGLNTNSLYTVAFSDDGINTGFNSFTSDGSGNILINGLNAGTYENFQVEQNTCIGINSTSLTLTDPLGPNLIINDPSAVCSPNTIDLTLPAITSGSSNIGSLSYWSDASGTMSLGSPNAVASSGTYYIQASTAGCTSILPVVVSVNPLPVFTLSSTDPTICDGSDGVVILSGLGNTMGYSVSYSYNSAPIAPTSQNSDAGGLLTILGLTEGSYDNITVTDLGTGCSWMNPGSLVLSDPPAPVLDLVNDATVCGNLVLQPITGLNLTGNEAYWTLPGGNGTQFLAGQTINSTQTLYLFDQSGNCIDEQSFDITVNTIPTILSVTGDSAYCIGEIILPIEVNVSGSGPWNIDYSLDGASQNVNSNSSPLSLGNTPGTYVINVLTDANCSNNYNQTYSITVANQPPIPVAGNDTVYCSDEVIIPITAAGTGGTLIWYSDVNLTNQIGSGTSLTPNSTIGTTIYFVTETNNGCEGAAATVEISINYCDTLLPPEIIVPTAFTPDQDNTNDQWVILNLDEAYPNNQVFVYNRWGSLIFESKEGNYSDNPWDGKFNEELLPVGTYYFIIELNNLLKDQVRGTITLLKE